MRFCLLFFISIVLLPVSCKNENRNVSVSEDDELSAYLLVYFKDATHGLYMALSADGYSFTDVNKGEPIMAGDTISLQKGIRDPHICRGPNGTFYLAMTDLHIYAQKAGYRETEWEREEAEYGWGNNRALVLMKSDDLINWSRTNLRIDETFPDFGDIGCAWAPEIIYDEEKEAMMVYFTMRIQNGIHKVYYMYMNEDFTYPVSEPQVIFEYPTEHTYIDADITKVGDKYHMFYVSHDGTAGIKQAVSDHLTHGYQFDPNRYDPETVATEAPNVWKRLGTDKWVLMYDVYGKEPHNFGFSETTDFITFTNLGHFNEGVMKATNFSIPKHGAVIHLTNKEAQQLSDHWNTGMSF